MLIIFMPLAEGKERPQRWIYYIFKYPLFKLVWLYNFQEEINKRILSWALINCFEASLSKQVFKTVDYIISL